MPIAGLDMRRLVRAPDPSNWGCHRSSCGWLTSAIMAIEITGISGSNADRVRRWCDAAFAALGHDPDLLVEVSGWGQAHVVASAGDGGVWLHRRLLDGADLRLGFIVYEEVAHVVLARAGVPNDNRDTTEAFWQELFATYVQLEALSKRTDQFDTWPVPPESPLGNLGKQIGAAHAGSAANRGHIENWQALDDVPDHKRQLVEHGLALAPPITTGMVLTAYRSS